MAEGSSYFLLEYINQRDEILLFNSHEPSGKHCSISWRKDGAGDRIVADVTQGVVHVRIPCPSSFRETATRD